MSSILAQHKTQDLKLTLPYRSMVLGAALLPNGELSVFTADVQNEKHKVGYEFLITDIGDYVRGAHICGLPTGQHVFFRTET